MKKKVKKEIFDFKIVSFDYNQEIILISLPNCEFYNDLNFVYYKDHNKLIHNYYNEYLIDYKTGYIFLSGSNKKQCDNKYDTFIKNYKKFQSTNEYKNLVIQYKKEREYYL